MLYTTGELAKVAGVSVRTLQYYDRKELLTPSSRTDNNRRIYNDDDLQRLKFILLLKNLGLSLKAISEILASQNKMQILKLMLNEQEKLLKAELSSSKDQLKAIQDLRKNLPDLENISLKTIDDIDEIMENKRELQRVHWRLLLYGGWIDVLEIITLIYWIRTGTWWPFAVSMVAVGIAAALLSKYYFNKTNYICPNCGTEFKPKFGKAFWASHNLQARKLTCPHCHQTNYCVEVFDQSTLKKIAKN